MITGKVWGETQVLLSTPLIEIHKLWIKPGHRCSLHVHKFKWNAFILMRGELRVEVIKNDYALTDVTVLSRPGDMTTVKPGEHHRFISGDLCDTEILEVYYTEPLSEDIERKDKGGPVE